MRPERGACLLQCRLLLWASFPAPAQVPVANLHFEPLFSDFVNGALRL
ncbi:conserved hypothetical protein [Rhodobacter capsulatus SB 1003]|uniref:Uncharacterized protein n=1 Tax=Rhodobacter capsulatus (strain ATCC BAA-309 / NBRC 16581 / SB1003) TaxID=272942 RepID=D5AQI8_RHOCB|nr:conserved hypothetical protein [Rhodobacter capsulatus SB 1003]